MLSANFHVPEISITNQEQIPYETTDQKIILNLKAIDTKYTLDRINVWINDIPIFGMNGINFRKSKSTPRSIFLTKSRRIPILKTEFTYCK